MRRYRITHRSLYRYDQTVTSSFNEVRLTPATTQWQAPLESVLRVDQATWQYRYVDYWGTQVRVVEAHTPHRDLNVEVSSQVEVDAARRSVADEGLDWEDVHRAGAAHAEFLTYTAITRPPVGLADTARELAAQHPPAEAARRIAVAVHETMTYLPGSTEVSTRAEEAWESRSGVCQDYAHLVVGALRHVGIPARYVSGYLHPSSEPVIGEQTAAESHAWVQWWLGSWTDHDPTNLAEVSDRHVLVGTGRDYGDVPPLKGIVAGTPVTTELTVGVEIVRMA